MGASAPIKVMGRYALFREIAAGGMAVVHLGRLHGPVGFSRTVAIKRLYPQYARDPEFVSMFLDEARLAARVRHPNVVPTLDVVASSGELFLVMDYVHGESLARLVRAATTRKERIPPKIILTIAVGALAGLHAAHEARGARGEPLNIVHRDISPQNILVGSDGVSRIVDFGVAKAAGRVQTTRDGQLKGKIGYFAPEQISGTVTRKTDIFAMSIVLWEALTGRRLFRGENDATTLYNLLHAPVAPPSTFAPEVPPAIDAAVLRGLERDPAKRFDNAREMALEIERHTNLASSNEVGVWVERLAQETLDKRAGFVAEVEGSGPDMPEDSIARIMAPSEPPPGRGGRDDADPDATVSGSIPRPAALPDFGSNPGGSAAAPPDGDGHEPSRSKVADGHASRPPPAESTGLSLATSLTQLGARRTATRRVWLGAAAFGAAVLIAFLFAAGKREIGTGPATSAPRNPDDRVMPDTSARPNVDSAQGLAAASDAGSATPPSMTSATVPSAGPTASAPAPKAQQPIVRKPDPRPPPRPPPVVKEPNNHCAVPYTLDATGRKKWKPECL